MLFSEHEEQFTPFVVMEVKSFLETGSRVPFTSYYRSAQRAHVAVHDSERKCLEFQSRLGRKTTIKKASLALLEFDNTVGLVMVDAYAFLAKTL